MKTHMYLFAAVFCLSLNCEKDPPTQPETQTKDIAQLTGWWQSSLRNDDTEMDIEYVKDTSTLRFEKHPMKNYEGDQLVYVIDQATYSGIDVYGRSVTMDLKRCRRPDGVPDVVVYSGEIFYPSGNRADSDVFFNYRIEVDCHYDKSKKAYMTECKGDINGHINSTKGKMTFEGTSNGELHVVDNRICCSERIDSYNFILDGKEYAAVTVKVVPIALYTNEKFRLDRETISINTEYADGSSRKSEVTIRWERDGAGRITAKTESGQFAGSEILNGKSNSIGGSIEIDCSGRHYLCDFYKIEYKEIYTQGAGLPKRVPFETIFVDDFFLRWFWWETES